MFSILNNMLGNKEYAYELTKSSALLETIREQYEEKSIS